MPGTYREGTLALTARSGAIALGIVLAVLAGFLAVNAVLTSMLERRLSDHFSQGIGRPATVDLQGWPAALRLVAGGVPRAEVSSGGGPVGDAPIHTLQATLFDVEVDARTLLDVPRPIRLTAVGAHLDVTFRPERAPLGASGLELRLRDITARLGTEVSGVLLTAKEAQVVASDLAFPDSSATLSRLEATLPELRLVKPAPTADILEAESADARFQALLTEPAANALWTLPGQVEFLPDVARLAVGPFTVDVHVRVAGEQVVLEPQVPPLLEGVVGALPPVSLRPNLPLGAVIEEVELQPGTMTLRGSSRKLQVPLQPRAPGTP